MRRRAGFRLCLAAALLLGPGGLAAEIVTDANIVTGLDISRSVLAEARRQQIAGIAAALRAPELLAAIRRGPEGRIGFAVFVWHHRRYDVLPWTLIAGPEDAEAAAREVETRIPVNVEAEARRDDPHPIGRLTDLSGAIDHAGALLFAAPFATGRGVANIVGNGADNFGEPAEPARDRLLATGASPNGVVPGGNDAVIDYYRQAVAGGPGAFVLAADGGAVMLRKFLRDLVAAHERR